MKETLAAISNKDCKFLPLECFRIERALGTRRIARLDKNSIDYKSAPGTSSYRDRSPDTFTNCIKIETHPFLAVTERGSLLGVNANFFAQAR